MSLESLPNYSTEVAQLHNTGLFNLLTHDGQGAFVDAVVSMLHGKNPRWGHLRKKPGQTAVHGHGEDAALFLYADGRAQAVDFIGGAGGPNPKPAWNVDPEIRYTVSDWLDPTEHAARAQACPPVPRVMPKGEAYAALQALNAFYQAPEGLQRPGGLVRPDLDGRSVADMEAIAQWFYQLVIEGVSLEQVFAQIRNSGEWQSKHPSGR
jgi:hypothetical protein